MLSLICSSHSLEEALLIVNNGTLYLWNLETGYGLGINFFSVIVQIPLFTEWFSHTYLLNTLTGGTAVTLHTQNKQLLLILLQSICWISGYLIVTKLVIPACHLVCTYRTQIRSCVHCYKLKIILSQLFHLIHFTLIIR